MHQDLTILQYRGSLEQQAPAICSCSPELVQTCRVRAYLLPKYQHVSIWRPFHPETDSLVASTRVEVPSAQIQCTRPRL